MDLPAELRVSILEQAVGAEHLPALRFFYPFWFCGRGSQAVTYGGCPSLHFDPSKRMLDAPNTNVIFTCKQIYREIVDHARFGGIKAFERIGDLRQYVLMIGHLAPGGLASLDHLTIDFSHRSYISFFGVKVAPLMLDDVGPPGYVCHGTPALE
jgi:hypothetical protein